MARIFDDLAKLSNLDVSLLPNFTYYKDMLDRVQTERLDIDKSNEWKKTARIWHDLVTKHPDIFSEQILNLSYIHRK